MLMVKLRIDKSQTNFKSIDNTLSGINIKVNIKQSILTVFKLDLLLIFWNILTTSKHTRIWLSVKADSLVQSIISNISLVSFILDGSLSGIGYKVFSTKI